VLKFVVRTPDRAKSKTKKDVPVASLVSVRNLRPRIGLEVPVFV